MATMCLNLRSETEHSPPSLSLSLSYHSWLSPLAEWPMLLIWPQHLVEFGAPSLSSWKCKEVVNAKIVFQYSTLTPLQALSDCSWDFWKCKIQIQSLYADRYNRVTLKLSIKLANQVGSKRFTSEFNCIGLEVNSLVLHFLSKRIKIKEWVYIKKKKKEYQLFFLRSRVNYQLGSWHSPPWGHSSFSASMFQSFDFESTLSHENSFITSICYTVLF